MKQKSKKIFCISDTIRNIRLIVGRTRFLNIVYEWVLEYLFNALIEKIQ